MTNWFSKLPLVSLILFVSPMLIKNYKGTNTLLLRGNRDREAKKHWGAPGTPKSGVKPYTGNRKEAKGGHKNVNV